MVQNYCVRCGAQLQQGSVFCMSCGAPNLEQEAIGAQTSAASQGAEAAGAAYGVPTDSPYAGKDTSKKPGFVKRIKSSFASRKAKKKAALAGAPVAPAGYHPDPIPYAQVSSQPGFQPVLPNQNPSAFPAYAVPPTTSAPSFESEAGTEIFGVMEFGGDNATTVLTESHRVSLRRNLTGETFDMECPFTIGKGSAANVQIAGNGAISRVHATVQVENDRYFLCDLGSTNGTFVQGSRIAPNSPVEIASGAPFMIADEEFALLM